jgi:hypothetical protein
VRVDIAGKTVGYLSRENARVYRDRMMDQGHPSIVTKCTATIRGGWDRGGGDIGYFGVWLDIPKNRRAANLGVICANANLIHSLFNHPTVGLG